MGYMIITSTIHVMDASMLSNREILRFLRVSAILPLACALLAYIIERMVT